MSGKQLSKLVEESGWELKRIQGSHYIYIHPEKHEILTIPIHGKKDLKSGTLNRLLKIAGLK